jgi:hypothetical protein
MNISIKYSTGATSYNVNELLIFSANNLEILKNVQELNNFLKGNNFRGNSIHYTEVLNLAEKLYTKQTGIEVIFTPEQDNEFCQIWADRFNSYIENLSK